MAGRGVAKWTTVERCDGTLTRALAGTLKVRDIRTGEVETLKHSESYLAERRTTG